MIAPDEMLAASIWPAVVQGEIQSLDEDGVLQISLSAENDFLCGWMDVPSYRRVVEGEMMRLTLRCFKKTRNCLILVEHGSLRDLDSMRQRFNFTVSRLKP